MTYDHGRHAGEVTGPSAPPRIAGHRTLDPARLPPEELDALCTAVHEVYRRIFVGIGADVLRRTVLLPEGEDTVLRVYSNAAGEIVGFAAFNSSIQEIDGRRVFVLRDAAGLLPAYRGRRVTYWYGFTQALLARLRHPFTPVCFMGVMVHPSSYHLMYRYYPRFFPHPEHGFPDEMRRLAERLVDRFPGTRIDSDRAVLRDTGWVTLETASHGPRPSRYKTTDVSFFEELNPGWPAGHGLVIVLPVTLRGLLTAFVRRLREWP